VATEAAWLNEKKDGNNHEESTKLLPWIGLLMEGVEAIAGDCACYRESLLVRTKASGSR